MKRFLVFLLAFPFLLLSCRRENGDDYVPDIEARFETPFNTRTSLSVDESGIGTIFWNPADQIDVFFGTTKVYYTSQNTSQATSAVFKTNNAVSSADLSSTDIWGLYPSSSFSSCDGNAVMTVLPSAQYGVPDTFDEDLFLAVAHSSTTSLQFFNVCGGIKFNLAFENIEKVTFSGNNSEVLAGTVAISFVDGVPEATIERGVREISLTPKTGTCFKKGTDYYIAILPGILSGGFTMTFTATDGSVGTFCYDDAPVTIKRSVFSRKDNIDAYASFEDERQPDNVIYYTTADGNVMTPYSTREFGAGILANEYIGGRGVITFDGAVTRIGDHSFYQCMSLVTIEVPESVSEIGGYAFAGCSGLKDFSIPESVTSIGTNAFNACKGLTSIVVPTNVANVGVGAFAFCDNLSSIVVDSGNQVYDSRGNCNAIIEVSSTTLVSGCKNTRIPEGVQAIGHSAFAGQSGIYSIDIPASVTSIAGHAFYECTSLVLVKIPESVTDIGGAAFKSCSGLMSLTVYAANPPWLADDLVFAETNNCPIYVPSGHVETYKTSWSEYAARIQSIKPNNVIYYTSSDKQVVTPNKIDVFGANIVSNEYADGRGVMTFDDDVRSIGDNAFENCTQLRSITIPSSVTRIGDRAFSNCFGLTSIEIPYSVSDIGDAAFRYCRSLSSIFVQSGNPVYDSRNNCNAIIESSSNTLLFGCMSTIIPDSVSIIGEGAFYGFFELYSIAIPNSVTSIGKAAFFACGLRSITIPGSVISIGDLAFNQCKSLYSVSIPNSVLSIGDGAFAVCESLTSIEIPESVASIGNQAFQDCSVLKTITLYPISPPSLGNLTFYGTNNCPMYVPMGSVEAYKVAWSEYADRIQLNVLPIDLGLPSGVKWAPYNVGATSPEEYGDYFAWGETEPKADYSWPSYNWCMGDYNSLTKYCCNSEYGYNGFTDTKTVLDPEDDVVHVNLGGKWRMPTDAEWTELRDNCSWTWTTQNKVNGMLVSASNGNSIFLPAAGWYVPNLGNVGSWGYYWSSTLYYYVDSPLAFYAKYAFFSSGYVGPGGTYRAHGLSVRPVSE